MEAMTAPVNLLERQWLHRFYWSETVTIFRTVLVLLLMEIFDHVNYSDYGDHILVISFSDWDCLYQLIKTTGTAQYSVQWPHWFSWKLDWPHWFCWKLTMATLQPSVIEAITALLFPLLVERWTNERFCFGRLWPPHFHSLWRPRPQRPFC